MYSFPQIVILMFKFYFFVYFKFSDLSQIFELLAKF